MSRRRVGVAGEVEDVRSVYRWVQAGHILHEVARSALPMAHNGNGFGFCFSCSLAEAFKIHAAHAGRGSRWQGEVRQSGCCLLLSHMQMMFVDDPWKYSHTHGHTHTQTSTRILCDTFNSTFPMRAPSPLHSFPLLLPLVVPLSTFSTSSARCCRLIFIHFSHDNDAYYEFFVISRVLYFFFLLPPSLHFSYPLFSLRSRSVVVYFFSYFQYLFNASVPLESTE